MKTGIACDYLRIYGDRDGLERMKKHGYDCLDYSGFIDTDSTLFSVSEAAFEQRLLQMRQAALDCGIEISQAHGPWRSPPHDYAPEQRAERFEKMVKSIRGAAILGCPYLVIHPIMPFGAAQDPEPQRTYEINYDFMQKLSEAGRDHNVVVCLENMPMTNLSLSRPAEILSFVKEINTPWLRICLDTGHVSVFDESPADAVRLIGKEYLRVLHVHDNNGRSDLHWIPYTGVIDWKDFSRALQEIDFKGVLSLETAVTKEIPAHIREHFEIGLAAIAKELANCKISNLI